MQGESKKLLMAPALLRQRFERLRIGQSRLAGMRASFEKREAELVKKVGLAKGRLALSEQTDAALEGMQNLIHQRSVGVFEELLSAILADALPESGPVKLELGTERGMPSLDISIKNGDDLEDALTGSGGAATNLLVAGLRFSALCRTNHRRFIVLDEPDCWLKPEHIPAFVKVLTGVSAQVGTQVVFVSHHDPSYFEGVVNMVKFNGIDKRTTQIEPIEPRLSTWADNETPGIRSIQLINFRKFENVTIPLSPGITAFIGDNNLGKSHAAIGALHAVAHGESTDKDIRHQEDEARVVITLEKNIRIEWTRKRKGSPKVVYALYEGDKEIHNGPPPARGQVPDWVAQVLGIARACGLDVQLHSQKTPVFLLNEPASVRAQLLSVGRESERLHALIEKYGDLKRKDRETVREGEAEISVLRARLNASVALSAINEAMQDLARALEAIETHSTKISVMNKIIARADSILQRRARFSRELLALAELPASPPVLKDTKTLAAYIQKVEGLSKTAAVSVPRLSLEPPVLKNTEYLENVATRISHLQTRAGVSLPAGLPQPAPVLKDTKRIREFGLRIAALKLRAGISLPSVLADTAPVLKNTDTIRRIGVLLSTKAKAYESAKQSLEQVDADKGAAEKALAEVVESLGGVCPTCSGPLPENINAVGHIHLQGAGL